MMYPSLVILPFDHISKYKPRYGISIQSWRHPTWVEFSQCCRCCCRRRPPMIHHPHRRHGVEYSSRQSPRVPCHSPAPAPPPLLLFRYHS